MQNTLLCSYAEKDSLLSLSVILTVESCTPMSKAEVFDVFADGVVRNKEMSSCPSGMSSSVILKVTTAIVSSGLSVIK